METDEDDSIIVRSTIDLAHNMGLKVVAEGVENLNTLHLLKDMGCDLIQGYYISRPIKSDTLQDWLISFRPDFMEELRNDA
jgi:EAL domain-containing protein (putative c-di-GMP-specific phosphodiesterase class I)